MIIPKELELFGFNDKEARVYLAALKLGLDTVQNIAEEADIHRVSVYDILAGLIDRGMISQTVKGKKRYFLADPPEKILDSIRSQKEYFFRILPELKAIQNKGKQRPRVMYYEGREAVWKAYEDRLKHQPELKENLVYGSSEKLLAAYPDEYRKFTRERLARGIKTKIIVEQSPSGKLEAETAKDQLREVKFLPVGKSFRANTVIYGDRVMTVSWESMLLVIIEDKDNAENQKILFNLLWDSLA